MAVDVRACLGTATGIGVYTRALLEALALRGGFELLAMAHRPPDHGGWLAAAGIGFEAQPALSGVVWQQLSAPRRLRRGDVDLFWSPLQTLPVATPVPSVVTVHDLTPLLFPETHTLKVRLSQLPFLARSLERAVRVVCDSEATAADVRRHFPFAAAKLRVILSGVDPAFQPASAREVDAIRAELGTPRGYLLYAGTLEPRKNVGALIDAWETLREEGEELALPLLLAGPYGWKSRPLVRRLERLSSAGVRHLGRVGAERLVRLMQGARVFVYPSLYEGFGLPPAEAMACGVPTVVSDTSSLPEVVGDAGLTVPPDDPGRLAAAIRRLLTDRELADTLRQRGLERARHWRWDRAAAELADVFMEALAAEDAA